MRKVQKMARTDDADGSLAADVRRFIEDGNAALRAQIAAMNKLRVAAGYPPYKLIEDRRAAA